MLAAFRGDETSYYGAAVRRDASSDDRPTEADVHEANQRLSPIFNQFK